MPTFHLDDLGGVGLIADIPPTELPANAFTRANNVAYRGRSVIRSGVFGALGAIFNTTTYGYPMKLLRLRDSGTTEHLFVMTDKGYIFETNGDTLTDRTVSGWTPGVSSTRKSVATLARRPYFSSSDGLIYGLGPSPATSFVAVMAGTAWEGSKWKVIRSFDGRLWGFNGSQASTNYYQRAIWSDLVGNDALATGWDTSSTTTTAGWVDLTGFRGEILDAQPLGGQLLIYGTGGVSRMYPSQDGFIYANELVMEEDGVLAMDCVVPVSKYGHFVVGQNTIYLFDGHTKQDIAVDRVEQLFRTTLKSGSEYLTYAFHDPRQSEVWVCYVSTDGDSAYTGTTYPNRALVWNYSRGGLGVWSVRDIPNAVDVATYSYAADAQTWEDLESLATTWATAGGTWALLSGAKVAYPVFISREMFILIDDTIGAVTPQLVAYTPFTYNFVVSDLYRNQGRFHLERTGFGLHPDTDPWSTKFFDQISIINAVRSGETLQVSTGSAMFPEAGYLWNSAQDFDGHVRPWLNMRTVGRYLSWRIKAGPTTQVNIPRVSARIDVLGDR